MIRVGICCSCSDPIAWIPWDVQVKYRISLYNACLEIVFERETRLNIVFRRFLRKDDFIGLPRGDKKPRQSDLCATATTPTRQRRSPVATAPSNLTPAPLTGAEQTELFCRFPDVCCFFSTGIATMSTIPMHGAPQDAQSQTSKRPSDAALESSPKRRKTLYQEAEEEASALAIQLQDTIISLAATFTLLQKLHVNTTEAEGTIHCWELVLKDAIAGEKRFGKAMQMVLDLRIDIPANYPHQTKLSLERANAEFEKFSRLFKRVLNSLPPPSEFARPSVWPTVQSSSAGIFCLRPTDNRGLPICTLHDVFRRFLVRLHEPLPPPSATNRHNKRVAGASIRATAMLCREMGDAFYSQGERSEYFDECVQELLPGAVPNQSFNPSSDVSSCQVDLVWFGPNGVPICLCKDNYEAGQTGYDIYLPILGAGRPNISCMPVRTYTVHIGWFCRWRAGYGGTVRSIVFYARRLYR
ncbi:uncharacterized protein LAESUDRAFT_188415 [Laetiporus sulphureus 93-53]|uniref:Uncharacterized protein n=1 Tax=Laetiporus sulphureus 93-53 TaxID=1314785 RepID=A0A165E5M4_9APHY|nr:uncharacterized protein LAESUDRAFT_188415 [Laetiporus sulphureus 93-53]KZT06284.1 hypothetical protein LAESUDRAFT_188415 [Laetiporus sulphureus 93-53]